VKLGWGDDRLEPFAALVGRQTQLIQRILFQKTVIHGRAQNGRKGIPHLEHGGVRNAPARHGGKEALQSERSKIAQHGILERWFQMFSDHSAVC